MSQVFPKDITDLMRDCILAILWPKADIISFFDRNGCTTRDLRNVTDYKEKGLSRSHIVDGVFKSLLSRDDNGLGQFRAILKSLLEWDFFDPYYFKELRKLDEQEAIKKLTHLRQLQEIRDAKLLEEKKKREERARNTQKKTPNLDEIKMEFLELYQGNFKSNQERGLKFEKILKNIIEHENLIFTNPFRIQGEQIDGSIKFDGEHYLIEAKWHDKLIASDALYHFAGKVEGKMYGRGLLISVNGYSHDSVERLIVGKAIRTILIDAEDIFLVLEGMVTFGEMLDAKVRAAQTEAKIYAHPVTLKSKV